MSNDRANQKPDYAKDNFGSFVQTENKIINDLCRMRATVTEMEKMQPVKVENGKMRSRAGSDSFYKQLDRLISAAEKIKESGIRLDDIIQKKSPDGPYEINNELFREHLKLMEDFNNIAIEIAMNPKNNADFMRDCETAKSRGIESDVGYTMMTNLLVKPASHLATYPLIFTDISKEPNQTTSAVAGFEEAKKDVKEILSAHQTKKVELLSHEIIENKVKELEGYINKLPKSSSSKKEYLVQLAAIKKDLNVHNYAALSFKLTNIYNKADESLEKRKKIGFYRKKTTSQHQSIRNVSFDLSQTLQENKESNAALDAAKPGLFAARQKKLQDAVVTADQEYANARRRKDGSENQNAATANQAKQELNDFLKGSSLAVALKHALLDNSQKQMAKVIKDYWPMFGDKAYLEIFMKEVEPTLTDSQRFNLTQALMAEYVAVVDTNTTGLLRVADHLSTRLYKRLMENTGYEPMNPDQPVPEHFNILNWYVRESISNEAGNKDKTDVEKHVASINPILLIAASPQIDAAGSDPIKLKEAMDMLESARTNPVILATLMNESVVQSEPPEPLPKDYDFSHAGGVAESSYSAESDTQSSNSSASDDLGYQEDFTDEDDLSIDGLSIDDFAATLNKQQAEHLTSDNLSQESEDLEAFLRGDEDEPVVAPQESQESQDLNAFLEGYGEPDVLEKEDEWDLSAFGEALKAAEDRLSKNDAPKGRELKDAIYQEQHGEARQEEKQRANLREDRNARLPKGRMLKDAMNAETGNNRVPAQRSDKMEERLAKIKAKKDALEAGKYDPKPSSGAENKNAKTTEPEPEPESRHRGPGRGQG